MRGNELNVSKNRPETTVESIRGFDGLSESENAFGVKLTIAKPVGSICAFIAILASLYFLVGAFSSPTLFELILSLLAIGAGIFSLYFGASEKEAAKQRATLKEQIQEGMREVEKAGKTQDFDKDYAIRVAEGMKHNVDPGVLRRKKAGKAPLDRLDDNENLQYILTGYDLDVDGNDEGHRSQLIVTDKKAVMIATSITAKTSQYTVSFNDIVGLSVQQRATSSIRIQTAGPSYKISVADSSNELAAEVVLVATGFCERRLGVHHPRTGGLAQGLDVPRE